MSTKKEKKRKYFGLGKAPKRSVNNTNGFPLRGNNFVLFCFEGRKRRRSSRLLQLLFRQLDFILNNFFHL